MVDEYAHPTTSPVHIAMIRAMKRLRLWVFNTITATSLLLFVATCVLWARSYRIQFAELGDPPLLSDYRGSIMYQKVQSEWMLEDYSHSGLGFVARRGLESILYPDGTLATAIVTTVAIPYWAIALLFSVMPTKYLIVRVKRLRRERKNCCPMCGYDLRATSDRCPECGTTTAKM